MFDALAADDPLFRSAGSGLVDSCRAADRPRRARLDETREWDAGVASADRQSMTAEPGGNFQSQFTIEMVA